MASYTSISCYILLYKCYMLPFVDFYFRLTGFGFMISIAGIRNRSGLAVIVTDGDGVACA